MVFSQCFTFHPVGQGLFYSGVLKLNLRSSQSHKFHMVFDCGSINNSFATKEVEAFRKAELFDKNYIDLLIISHFDMDHCSHVKDLVKGKKIRRLVLPFMGYAERLVLSLRIVEESIQPLPAELIGFILDPISSLGDSLDGDSIVYLIESGSNYPDGDFPNDDKNPELPIDNLDGTVSFGMNDKEQEDYQDDGSFGSSWNSIVKIFKVSDRIPGIASYSSYDLMDFIFYKKKLTDDDKAFYDKVLELFSSDYSSIEGIIEAVVNIGNAGLVKKLFRDAADSLGIKKSKVDNLNFSSLCMLHRNLKTLDSLLEHYDSSPFRFNHDSYLTSLVRVKNDSAWRTYRLGYYFRTHFWVQGLNYDKSFFPNTLLTSDTFILSGVDLAAFLNRYRFFLPQVSLAQIPHHGSRHSVSSDFFSAVSQASPEVVFFCNHSFRSSEHPSKDVIGIINGLDDACYFSITEFTGLKSEIKSYY